MRKTYPYLQDVYYSYTENDVTLRAKRNFLKMIDNFVNQKQYVKVTLLDWHENPIKEIQGELTSGTLTKDASSPVRRSCQFSATLNRGEYDLDDIKFDFSLNKKAYIEIGIKNYTKYYPEYPILWFPQGTYFLNDCSVASSSSTSVTINLTLRDKMCQLNGVNGGTFNSTTIFDEKDTQTPTGEYVSEKVLIHDIIQEVVHHFGGEDLHNIIIEDVPLRIKRIVKWSGSTPAYLILNDNNSGDLKSYDITIQEPTKDESGRYPVGTIEVKNGEDIGYVYDDFVYTGELTGAAGDNVCTILDKIVTYLGNYEYFYDEYGIFHFQEIKNYLNTSLGSTLLSDMSKKDYLVEVNSGKAVYAFEDDTNLISINSTPQYENIKNDFVVNGLRKSDVSDYSYPVMYHLAIDTKPRPGNQYTNVLIYTEDDTNLIKAAFPMAVSYIDESGDTKNILTDKELFEKIYPGDFNIIYRVGDGIGNNYQFFFWNGETYKEVNIIKYYLLEPYITQDWRTEIYMQGMRAKTLGLNASVTNSNTTGYMQNIQQNTASVDFYFEELEAFWPEIYNLADQEFYNADKDGNITLSSFSDGNYYLDFIEPSSAEIGEFSISNIGRRTNVTYSEDINCLFEPEIPDIVFINTDDEDAVQQRIECQIKGQDFVQTTSEIFDALMTGGWQNGAFEQIRFDLYTHTIYQRSVAITALPAFYLEPNVLTQISDKTTNTYGNFMIQNITLPLGTGNMTVTANEIFEKL